MSGCLEALVEQTPSFGTPLISCSEKSSLKLRMIFQTEPDPVNYISSVNGVKILDLVEFETVLIEIVLSFTLVPMPWSWSSRKGHLRNVLYSVHS